MNQNNYSKNNNVQNQDSNSFTATFGQREKPNLTQKAMNKYLNAKYGNQDSKDYVDNLHKNQGSNQFSQNNGVQPITYDGLKKYNKGMQEAQLLLSIRYRNYSKDKNSKNN